MATSWAAFAASAWPLAGRWWVDAQWTWLLVVKSAEYIDSMFVSAIKTLMQALPSQCRVCHAWPAQSICEACVNRFAQPQSRCQTCAMPVPTGVGQCGACIKAAPPLDACLAAVSYAYPWSDLITGYKFHNQTGLCHAFALFLRSAPWVERALEAADAILPMPLARERFQSRGFNQALVLARELAPDKTDASLLLRIKDTPAQTSLQREDRLGSLKDAFAVDPLLAARIKGARLVLVDDVMTTGASLYVAARTLRAAGVA
jgi:ComF family protein